MTSATPLVSVLMTAYNREKYIAEALESVLASTCPDIEIVVSDDASADRTLEIASDLARRDSRIRVYGNESNLGDYLNRNRAASYARGKYLKYLDSDDILYPHALEVMVRCMEAFPQAGFGLSAVMDTDAPFPRFLTPVEAYREHYFGKGLLSRAPGSAIIRRTSFEAVGGFSGRRQVGDHELWLSMARSFGLVKMPAELVWTRQHGEQEKFYDSEVEKAVMHDEILLAALNETDCPLGSDERKAALDSVMTNRVRTYWLLLMQGGGRRAAGNYRRRVRIPLNDIMGFALQKLRRRIHN